MNTLVKNALIATIVGTGSTMALAQDLGPIATGLAAAMQTADPVIVETGAERTLASDHYGTHYSIGGLLQAVSEDIAAELEGFMDRHLASEQPAKASGSQQVVSTY